MSYRILSLDGGGSWALLEVQALTALYDANTTGHEILADFDMVAANSGGSLVLGGLVEDLSLGAILDMFNDDNKRRSIFSPTNSLVDQTLQSLTGIGPKYSADAKLPAIELLMPKRGNLPLSAAASGIRRSGSTADVHLLVIGFDYDRNKAQFFRSARSSSPGWGDGALSNVTLAEAIHASTNAPVNYFDKPASFPDQPNRYWDGGVTGCNNPVLAAVTEAIGLAQKPTDIIALSIGTATVNLPLADAGQPSSTYTQSRADSGLVPDLKKLASSILDDPPDIASFLAHVMTGCGAGLPGGAQSRVVRMNPLIRPVRGPSGAWTAPANMTPSQFSYLAGLDMDAIQQAQVNFIASYGEWWVAGRAPNQPVRMDGTTYAVEIGDATFTDAVASWRKIKGI